MLSQLSTLKSRLEIPEADVQYDTLLTRAIEAVSARFDLETSRTLARTVDATFEFPPDDTNIAVPCYPVETVTSFDLKTSESEGWVEQPGVEFLVRARCVISLAVPLSIPHLPSSIARLTYTGGYVLPGTVPGPGQTPLPPVIESAAVEQVAFWFQNKDKLGQIRSWPASGNYVQLADTDLLPSVTSVLRRYTRLLL